MRVIKCLLLCALLAVYLLEPVIARKSFGRGGSYPKSTGLSGSHGHSSGGRHGYPSSGGLSGGSHTYPSSGGLSGGGGHTYPGSGGLSGGGGGYPSSGNKYPSSSGSHSYPASSGISGTGSSNTHHTATHGYPANKGVAGSTGNTNVHYHYHYNPPKEIRYTPAYGGPARSYPVYHGTPPSYVYQYKDSGSKYGTLLAGLALLNLGTLGVAAYAASNHGSSNNNYKARPNEICKFGVKKDNGDYEETRIDCQLISSFILAEEANKQNQPNTNNTTITTTVFTNVTNATVVTQDVMLPNGTLVPMNVTLNATGDGTMVTSITTTNVTTVTNAIDVKGKPIDVTPTMQCFVIRHSPDSTNMRKTVPCGLLQTYAERSLKRNSAARNAPTFTILALVVAAFVMTT